ncbi:MAG: AAA family ATPase [Gammaproteobacteria bacterium]|nr:AAA family ATPase [Gammaproteobacteria bacterium]
MSDATKSKAGAYFHRCALQVNPDSYREDFRGQPTGVDEISHARAVIAKAVELGINVLAITDHNSVASITAFRAAASGQDIVVFPGFELSTSEGVHVLCLYPPETELDVLQRYLGEFGIRNPAPSSDTTPMPLSRVLRTVASQAGIAVAAHVTGASGLFKKLSGQPLIRAWRDANLLAVQIPGHVDDLPQNVRQIMHNDNPHYRRDQAAAPSQAVAAINAKDIVQPDDLANPAATSWIKMDNASIDGLRQAFLDPDSRIRLNDKDGNLEIDEHMELVSLGWEGGFLGGVNVHLNPNLNVLIGGRGAGKSTFVESLRAVLGLQPNGEDAAKAHDGIVRYVLRSGTKITLRVRVQRPGTHEYDIERTIPNPPIVRDTNGEVLHLGPQDVLPRIEVFGQHEISELAKSPEKLTRLLDRFVERDESLAQRKDSLRSELAKNRRALVDTQMAIRSGEDRLAGLPGMEETLARFHEVGLEERLRDRSLLVREERVLGSIPERLAPFRDALETIRRELPIDLAFLSDRALADLPGGETLSNARGVLTALGEDIERVATDLGASLARAEDGIERIRVEWDVRRQESQTEYERILRELHKARVDGEEFIELRRRIEELRPVQERLVALQRLAEELNDKRRTLLAEWEDTKATEFRTFDKAAAQVNKELRNRVQVDVTAGANREPLFTLLRNEVRGRLSETVESLRKSPDLSLTQFVAACRSGARVLNATYGVVPRQAERLAEADADVLMQIEELDLAATTAIQLNTAPEGEPPSWHPLDDLSTGQKATAVLLLLLLESGAPLIVDQPEDDLDNRFITEGVIPRMREEKQRRQFVFSTHNANIPVLGDAELILGLSAAGEAADGQAEVRSDHAGSIDAPSVRELVEEILEGGREAFETRRRKYGF